MFEDDYWLRNLRIEIEYNWENSGITKFFPRPRTLTDALIFAISEGGELLDVIIRDKSDGYVRENEREKGDRYKHELEDFVTMLGTADYIASMQPRSVNHTSMPEFDTFAYNLYDSGAKGNVTTLVSGAISLASAVLAFASMADGKISNIDELCIEHALWLVHDAADMLNKEGKIDTTGYELDALVRSFFKRKFEKFGGT